MLRGLPIRSWRRLARLRVYLLPAVLLLAVTVPKLHQGDFRGDAGWYSAIGLQAWRTGELWTLYADPGQPYFNKPPLAFWIHGLVLHILGPSVWAARLPSILAALGCVLVTTAIARDLAGRRAAVFSGVVLALTLEFFRRTREISLDMWQALFLLLAAWAVVRAVGVSRSRERLGMACACGLAAGLALLTKPLVGLLLFPVAGLWLLWIRRAGLLPWLGLALLASVAVAAPWHLSMADLHGREFLAQYFGAEIADRARGQALPGHETAPPAWFYLRNLGELYWPWLIFVGFALADMLRGRLPPRGRPAAALALLWAGLWLLFLTLYPDRRDRYAIIIYPGLAILAGLWLAGTPWLRFRRAERAFLRLAPPAALALGLILALAPIRVQRGPDRHWQELYAWMRDQGSPQLWQGGIAAHHGARIYLEFNAWPQTTRNRWGDPVATPPEGALLMYHHRGGLRPGENETRLFRSVNGDLLVTRLGGGPWLPSPGELD